MHLINKSRKIISVLIRWRRLKITRVIIALDVKTRISVRIIFEGKRDMAATVAMQHTTHAYSHTHA